MRGHFAVPASLACLVMLACSGHAPPPQPAPAAPEPATPTSNNPVDYLVVGPAALIETAHPLVALRDRLGHGIRPVVIEELGAITPDAVREAIARQASEHPGLRFVLLLGDPAHGGAPSFMRHSAFGEPFLSDVPYSELAGGRTLAVGRIPARTAAELDGVVDKIIRYETEPVHGGWQRRINMFAGPAKFGIVVDALIERAVTAILEQVPYDFDVNVTFAKPSSPYADRVDRMTGAIADELARGSLVTVYTGHGLPHALDTVYWRNAVYEIGTTADLAPVRIPHGSPFFVSLTCLTGAFGMGGQHRSLAEELVLNPQGPVAVFAASASSHPVANVVLGRGFLDYMFTRRTDVIGTAIAATRGQLVNPTEPAYQLVLGESSASDKLLWKNNAEMYNLFGDPATRPRYPESAAVTLPAPITAGATSIAVDVAADLPGGATIELTLELQRSDLRGPFVSESEQDAMEREAALEAMSSNHARANDRVLARSSGLLENGRATIELPLPRGNPGHYAIKALIAGGGRVAAGHTFIDLN